LLARSTLAGALALPGPAGGASPSGNDQPHVAHGRSDRARSATPRCGGALPARRGRSGRCSAATATSFSAAGKGRCLFLDPSPRSWIASCLLLGAEAAPACQGDVPRGTRAGASRTCPGGPGSLHHGLGWLARAEKQSYMMDPDHCTAGWGGRLAREAATDMLIHAGGWCSAGLARS
jgi:hypothetical protein